MRTTGYVRDLCNADDGKGGIENTDMDSLRGWGQRII